MTFLILIIILLLFIDVGVIFFSMKLLVSRNVASAKIVRYYQIMVEWVRKYQTEKSIEEYLLKYGYKSVAIYGMKDMGELLLNDLVKCNANVLYVVDRDESISVRKEIIKYTPDDNLPNVDVMIVTASFYFDEIKALMKSKGMKCDIVSIDDVICEY